MLGSVVKFINKECFELGVSIIDFLIEVIQGPCKPNQEAVVKFKVLDFCKDFIHDLNSSKQDLASRGFDTTNKDDSQILNNMFNKIVKLLMSILEFN